jgi:flavin-dependent dehydrogenase
MTGARHVDVAIVGGRVSGCVLASLLGDAGLTVLVLEREAPGTDTLSTHYTTGEGMVGMEADLGVLDEVLALGTPPLICEYRFYGEDPAPVVIPTHSPGRIGFALSVRRQPLDAILQARARRTPGVTLLPRTRVTSLARDGEGRVTGLCATTPDGPLEVRAGIVVGADGRHSSVARWVDAAVEREDPATRSLVFRYVRGYRGPDGRFPDGSEFSLHGDEALYAFPSDDDTACVALSVPVARFDAARGDLDALWNERLPRHPGIARRVAATTPAGDGRLRGTRGMPNWVRRAGGPGWALLGDAGLHLDPWTGRGMDFAATHARFLARAILAAAAGADQAAELARYQADRDAHALGTYQFTVEGARDLAPFARHEPWGIPRLPAPPPGRYPTPA